MIELTPQEFRQMFREQEQDADELQQLKKELQRERLHALRLKNAEQERKQKKLEELNTRNATNATTSILTGLIVIGSLVIEVLTAIYILRF